MEVFGDNVVACPGPSCGKRVERYSFSALSNETYDVTFEHGGTSCKVRRSALEVHEFENAALRQIPGSSNGRTAGLGLANAGSTPAPGAKTIEAWSDDNRTVENVPVEIIGEVK